MRRRCARSSGRCPRVSVRYVTVAVRMVRPEVRGVVTPEAVILEFETGSIGSRALAQVVDLGVRIGLFYGLLLLAGAAGFVVGRSAVVVILIVGGFLLIFGYPVLCEARWRGRTIGKRMLGLRV